MDYTEALAKIDTHLADMAAALATITDDTEAEAMRLRIDATLELRTNTVKLHRCAGE